MSRSTCIKALAAEGIELDKTQLDWVGDRVEKIIEDAKASGDDVFGAVQKSIDEHIDELSEMVNVVKKNAALNKVAKSRLKNYVEGNWGDEPAEGFRTMLTGVQADRVGAKDAVAVLQSQLADKYIGNLVSRLEKVGPDGNAPMDYVKPAWWGGKNKNSTQVMRIMFYMNQDNPDTSKYAGKPPEMIKAARILLDAQEATRKDANSAGSYIINKADNRIMRRTHDGMKMGGKGEKEWKADMVEWFDMKRSGVTPEEMDGILTAHYNQSVSGRRTANPNSLPESNGRSSGGNISKLMASERVFVAKSVEAEIAYFEKYARGDLLETIVFDLEVSAQRIGLMRRFGPNAEANYDAVAQEIGYNLRNKSGGEGKYKKFEERMEYIKNTHWPQIDGSLFVPAKQSVAKWGQIYRSVKMMALLGKAVITSVVDIPIYGTQVKYSGGSFFAGMAEAIKVVGTSRSAGQREVLSGMGVMADGLRNATLARFDPDHISAGYTAKATELFFRLNLLTPWTDRLRTGYALARSNELAGHSKKSFKQLSPEWQRSFKQFNIDEAEWNVIRKGALKEFDGRRYITPEGLEKLDEKFLIKYLEAKDLPVNKLNIDKYRTEIADRFGSLYNYTANTAALTPDAGTRALMLQGSRAGTTGGELIRFAGLFKSFPTAYMRQVLGRDVLGHRKDIPTSRIDKYANNTAIMNMTRTIASTTLFGFMAMYIDDFVTGKEPMDLTEENFSKIFLESMMKGGSLGHYAELLIGEASEKYGTNIITGMLGPLAQDIQTVYDIKVKMFSTDPEISSAGLDALMMLFKNVPGNNLYFTKMAFDYLIIYNMMELTDPGSLQRMEQSREKSGAADFRYQPSTAPTTVF